MSTTLVASCTCKHAFQDKRYGTGKRVFNQTKEGWRCTVCVRVRTRDVSSN